MQRLRQLQQLRSHAGSAAAVAPGNIVFDFWRSALRQVVGRRLQWTQLRLNQLKAADQALSAPLSQFRLGAFRPGAFGAGLWSPGLWPTAAYSTLDASADVPPTTSTSETSPSTDVTEPSEEPLPPEHEGPAPTVNVAGSRELFRVFRKLDEHRYDQRYFNEDHTFRYRAVVNELKRMGLAAPSDDVVDEASVRYLRDEAVEEATGGEEEGEGHQAKRGDLFDVFNELLKTKKHLTTDGVPYDKDVDAVLAKGNFNPVHAPVWQRAFRVWMKDNAEAAKWVASEKKRQQKKSSRSRTSTTR